MKEKYGFVYIWFNKKRKMYYIGCHWGDENDGYICSSTWMRNSYNRHREDFKRKILYRIYTNRKDLLEEEYHWLQLIKDKELGKRYYNLSKKHFGHWFTDENKILSIKEKISLKNKGRKHSLEARENMKKRKNDPEVKAREVASRKKNYEEQRLKTGSSFTKEHLQHIKEKCQEEEYKNKQRQAKLGKPRSEEIKKKISMTIKQKIAKNEWFLPNNNKERKVYGNYI